MKRKILALCLVLLLCLTVFYSAPAAATENLLSDGGFESFGETGESADWVCYSHSNTSSIEPLEEAAVSGNYGIRIAGNSEDAAAGVWQVIENHSGLTVKASVWVKIVDYAVGDGIRLIARKDTFDGDALSYTSFKNTTGGEWEQFSITCTLTDNSPVFFELMCANPSSGFVIYADDFVVEEVEPELINGNLDILTQDESDFEGWGDYRGAAQTEEEVIAEEGRGYVACFTTQGYIGQTMSIRPATKYRLTFDIKSSAAVGEIKVEMAQSVVREKINTGGVWQREFCDFTTGEDEYSVRILLRYVGADGAEVYYDNAAVTEIADDGECVTNGEFEYGADGVSCWTTEGNLTNSTATLTKSADAYEGAGAVKITNSTTTGAASLRQTIYPAHSKDTLYEFSAMVRLDTPSTSQDAQAVLCLEKHKTAEGGGYVSDGGAINKVVLQKDLPVGKWVRLTMMVPLSSANTRAQIKVRVIYGGSVSFDAVSAKPLVDNKVYFSTMDGAETEKINGDGTRVTVYLAPAYAKDDVMVATAVYKEYAGADRLSSLVFAPVTENHADGYRKIEFDISVPADFAERNYYAKVFVWESSGGLCPITSPVTAGK